MTANAPAIAQQKPKTVADEGPCSRPDIKKVVLDALNASVEFQERKIKVVDFQNGKTTRADPATNTISCRGVMVLDGGQKFAGVLTIAAPGKKTDIDWYDDDKKNGLVNFSGSGAPTDEAEFIKVITLARAAYQGANTEFAKGAMRPQRAKAICGLLKPLRANNWIGKLTRLTTNSDGKGVLAVEIAPDIQIKTFSTELSDIGSHTLIEPDSRLYSDLSVVSEGDQVRFTGAFLPKDADCIQEVSLTMNGAMISPEFIMRFATVQKTSN